MNTKFETWSPFQSPQVRDICEHMTDAELSIARQRAIRYGLWVVATVAGPFGFAVGFPGTLAWSVSGLLMVIYLASIPIWLQMQRRFLSSTIWAKEQGMKPEGSDFVFFISPCRLTNRMQRTPRLHLGCILFTTGAGSLIRSIVRRHEHGAVTSSL